MNRSDPILAGVMDMNRVGTTGWSWGAVTVTEFCRVDPRGKASVCLDGRADATSAPELYRLGLKKPLVMLNASNNDDTFLFSLTPKDAYWIQLSNTIHDDFGGYDWWGALGGSASAREATRTITAYILSFLNKHLKGEDDHLLDAKSPQFPRVGTFRKK